MRDAASVIVRELMCLLDNRDEVPWHGAAGGLVDASEKRRFAGQLEKLQRGVIHSKRPAYWGLLSLPLGVAQMFRYPYGCKCLKTATSLSSTADARHQWRCDK